MGKWRNVSLRVRFENMVERTDTCWLWRGAITKKGFGTMHVTSQPRKVSAHAHRIAWELYRGPIPDGLTIDHLCRVKHCVNPAHMEPVTSSENTRRSDNPAMQNARATHCKNGHEWTPENTLRQGPQGQWRWCRECGRARSREYMRNKRGQS